MASIDWNGRINSYLQRTGTIPAGASEILATLGSACQAAVENAIGRTLAAEDYSELYSGEGKPVLFLRHDPIVTLTSVMMDGNTLTITDPNEPVLPVGQVAVNSTRDGLVLTSGDVWSTTSPLNIRVVYSAGLEDYYTNVPPDDITFAVTYWAAMFFRRRDRIGEQSSSIGGQITSFTQDIPADVKLMIERRRRPFIPC